VNEVVSGREEQGSTLVVQLYGGTAAGVVQETNGPAVPRLGDELLLMLRNRPGIGSHQVFDMMPIDGDGILRYGGETGCSPMQQLIGTPSTALIAAVREADDEPVRPPATLDGSPGTTTPTVD
jgi:hypothetical protein